MAYERALSLIKPDGVARRLVGAIIHRFEEKQLALISLRVLVPDETLIRATYWDKQDDDGFADLLAYMTGGPVVAMAWAGENANERVRQVIGVISSAVARFARRHVLRTSAPSFRAYAAVGLPSSPGRTVSLQRRCSDGGSIPGTHGSLKDERKCSQEYRDVHTHSGFVGRNAALGSRRGGGFLDE